jgi:hypothetical protein
VFETEEQDGAGAPQEGAAAPGVTIAKLQLGEVIAVGLSTQPSKPRP